jgi:hypothetical protein
MASLNDHPSWRGNELNCVAGRFGQLFQNRAIPAAGLPSYRTGHDQVQARVSVSLGMVKSR